MKSKNHGAKSRIEEVGQGFVEYAIILIFVGIAVVLIVSLMQPAIGDVFSRFVPGSGRTALLAKLYTAAYLYQYGNHKPICNTNTDPNGNGNDALYAYQHSDAQQHPHAVQYTLANALPCAKQFTYGASWW